MWVAFLAEKSSSPESIKKINAAAENKGGRKLRTFRTDNSSEVTSVSFAEYFVDQSVERHHSTPHTPKQNGVVERRNQSVVAMACALLKQRGKMAIYWVEKVSTAMFLLNHSPTRALSDKTPYEAWHGSKPAVQFLHTFGCLVYMKELGHHGKLEDQSTLGIFIDYEEGVKAYQVLDPVTQHVRTTRDVVFDEDRGWSWSEGDGNTGATPTLSSSTWWKLWWSRRSLHHA
jgi:transposase InsO family protein